MAGGSGQWDTIYMYGLRSPTAYLPLPTSPCHMSLSRVHSRVHSGPEVKCLNVRLTLLANINTLLGDPRFTVTFPDNILHGYYAYPKPYLRPAIEIVKGYIKGLVGTKGN